MDKHGYSALRGAPIWRDLYWDMIEPGDELEFFDGARKRVEEHELDKWGIDNPESIRVMDRTPDDYGERFVDNMVAIHRNGEVVYRHPFGASLAEIKKEDDHSPDVIKRAFNLTQQPHSGRFGIMIDTASTPQVCIVTRPPNISAIREFEDTADALRWAAEIVALMKRKS